MSRYRAELLAAAAKRLEDPSEESTTALCRALESYLRASGAAGDPDPAECDGVVLREEADLEDSTTEFLGFAWLVAGQKVTPLRVRFWPSEDGLEFEVRFGVLEIQTSPDELDRMSRRGRFPQWSDGWAVSLRG